MLCEVILKNFKFLLTFLLVCLAILIATSPERFINSALNGLSAFAINVLPCTLPFMIITSLIIDLGALEKICKPLGKVFQKFYGTSSSSSYVFLMSIMAGYPVGSKMTADLYEKGQISRSQAFKMSAFCSNSGPMFIIGTVGTILLGNATIGAILFFSHILSALINGLIYKNIKVKEMENLNKQSASPKTSSTFGEIVSSSVIAALNVGAIICLFFIIIDALNPIFSLLPANIKPLFEGMIELTRGCIDSANLPPNLACIICSFLISFGGFSTIMQSKAMLKKLKMPTWLFSVQKFSQGLISAFLTFVLISI